VSDVRGFRWMRQLRVSHGGRWQRQASVAEGDALQSAGQQGLHPTAQRRGYMLVLVIVIILLTLLVLVFSAKMMLHLGLPWAAARLQAHLVNM
jgi:hypothetical protein